VIGQAVLAALLLAALVFLAAEVGPLASAYILGVVP
jgi:hypothetical protein